MLSINYPKKYQNEETRIGKKFKYYKIEPIEMKKTEKKKEIKIGNGSGRIATLQNWSKNPQQGNINFLNEDFLCESFSELVESYLEEVSGKNHSGN